MAERPRSTMGSEVKEKATEAQQKAEEVAGQAKQEAKDLAHQAQQQAKSALSTRKDQAAHELNTVAQAFRETGNQLHQQNKELVADYTNRLAERVEGLSTYLEDNSVDAMLADVEDFARSQPELFIGGALALGLLGARFLKSSNERRQAGQWSSSQWYRYPGPEPTTHS